MYIKIISGWIWWLSCYNIVKSDLEITDSVKNYLGCANSLIIYFSKMFD